MQVPGQGDASAVRLLAAERLNAPRRMDRRILAPNVIFYLLGDGPKPGRAEGVPAGGGTIDVRALREV